MYRLILSFLAMLVITQFPTIVSAQTKIGAAEAINTRVNGKGARNLKAKSSIFANERLRANRSGLGHFRFNDNTKLVVGPNSRVVLDDVIYNPNRSKFKKFVLDSSAGATRFISGNSGSNAYDIETPVGTIGVRGTALDIHHIRGRTYVMLLEGSIRVCSNSGECRTLTRRCECAVINAIDVSKPFLPVNGIFSDSDMSNFFPFIANPSQILPDYRVARWKRCQGGATPDQDSVEPSGNDAPSGESDAENGDDDGPSSDAGSE